MTTAGRSGRTSRDRGAVATEFGLLVTLVSILVTGGIAALLGQVWHFDPCEIFQVCSNDSGQSPPGASGDGADGGTVDPSTVPPSTDLADLGAHLAGADPVGVGVAHGLPHATGLFAGIDRHPPARLDGLRRLVRSVRPLT